MEIRGIVEASLLAAIDGDHDQLWNAFIWSSTSQGDEYWHAIASGEEPLDDVAKGHLRCILLEYLLEQSEAPKPKATPAPSPRQLRVLSTHWAIRSSSSRSRKVREGSAEGMYRESMVHKLEAEGYRYLGNGLFATALYHPERPDEVLKVGDYGDGDNFNGMECDGWLTYFDRVVRRSRSKHVPKVHEVTLYEHFYVVRMERLRECRNRYDEIGLYSRRSCQPAVKRLAQRLQRLCSDVGHGFDLHPGNIMARADGTLVITDPFC
jgi:hypothetical protein